MRVNFYATLRPLIGGKSVELALAKGTTVRELAHELVRRWPALGEHLLTDEGAISRRVNFFVEGRSVRWLPEGDASVLSSTDSVDVFPPVAGG